MILTCNKEVIKDSNMSLTYNNKKRDSNVILRANNGGVGPLTVLTPITRNIPVVSVNIDAIEMKHPSILLMFTAQINMLAELNVNLIFTIKKYTDNKSLNTIGGTYVFSSRVETLETKAFTFQFYDRDVNPNKYIYIVEIAQNSFMGTAGLTITNAVLSALAVDE